MKASNLMNKIFQEQVCEDTKVIHRVIDKFLSADLTSEERASIQAYATILRIQKFAKFYLSYFAKRVTFGAC